MASGCDHLLDQARWASLTRHLRHVATKTEALTLQDGTRHALSVSGLSVHSASRERPSAANWLRQSHLAQVLAPAGITLPAPQRGYHLSVQWRSLLSKAFLRHASASHVPAALRTLAHHAWWAALPVVKRYDVVFADMLTKSYDNYVLHGERTEFEPFWVGVDSLEDELRFDAHASFLLSLRRTAEAPFNNFCEDVMSWFRQYYSYAANSSEERVFGFCTVNDHRSGNPCETCPDTYADRPFTSLFDGDVLLRKEPSTRAATAAAVIEGPADPSVRCFRWILEARSRIDGVARFNLPIGTPARVINIRRLHERWKKNGFPSVVEEYAVSTSDGLKEAYRHMLGFIGGSLLPPSVVPFEQMYLESEWGDEQGFAEEAPYLIAVSDASLLLRLSKLGHRTAALRKARAARKVEKYLRPARRRIQLPFSSMTGGPAYDVFVVRGKTVGKMTKNFFSTPFAVHGPRTDPRNRAGQGVLVDGQLCWTVQSLHSVANETTPDGDPVYPLAKEFALWAESHDLQLTSDRAFQNALYASTIGERLTALTTGAIQHLGRYSEKEDGIIRLFFATGQKKKRLRPTDWALLLQRLPGRTERGILRRLDELGREFAFLNGYEAYVRSPYHRKFSSTRKTQWKKEGCPP